MNINEYMTFIHGIGLNAALRRTELRPLLEGRRHRGGDGRLGERGFERERPPTRAIGQGNHPEELQVEDSGPRRSPRVALLPTGGQPNHRGRPQGEKSA